MNEYVVQGSIAMTRGSMLRIDDGAGILVYVWEGEVWLTQEGGREDHVLGPGQWFRLDRGGAAIAHAFRRSALMLTSTAPEPYARSITLAGAGSAGAVPLYRGRRSQYSVRGRLVGALRGLLAGLFAPRGRSTSAPL
jgi:hypothetical protein